MDAYLRQLSNLMVERQKLDRHISKLEKVLRGMIDLLDTDEEQTEYIEKLDEIRPPAGLTEAIQQVLQSGNGAAFLPTEIRDRVKNYLLNHSNEMASVHTTLKRIHKLNPLAFETVEKDGKIAYRWVSAGEQMMRDFQRGTARIKLGVDTKPSAGRKTLGRMIGDGLFSSGKK